MRMLLLAVAAFLTFGTSSVAELLQGTREELHAEQAATNALFSSYDLLEVTLEGPFQELFLKAQQDPDFAVPGSLTYADAKTGQRTTIDGVRISTRGHTSRRESECEFPKLKLQFDDGPDGESSPFAGMKNLKLGTHCGERPDGTLSARYGRWANEKAPHREAFVYRLLDAVNVPSLQARPGRITYVFSDRTDTDRRLVRNAMFLEDDSEVIKRLGGVGDLPAKKFTSAQTSFSPRDTAKLTFAQALIGNFDWCLRMFPADTYRCNDTNPLWNVLGIVKQDGTAVPIIHDFDLAGIVVLSHKWLSQVLNAEFVPSGSEPEVEVLSQLQRARAVFSRQELDASRAEFMTNKAAAYEALEQSVLDDQGRATAKAYMDSFFAIIEDDRAFYRPAVIDPNARIYVDAAKSQPACGTGAIPLGTPVGPPVETSGDMSRVLVLDALWHWQDKNRCDLIRKETVWMASSAIGTEFPSR
jgi:hypothetical protein